MKKFLPKSVNNSSGFTLIELMIVVAIIAILAIVGISLYSGAQANARDGIRRIEINSLGKSIETAKDPTSAKYVYKTANFTSDFPQSQPHDPHKIVADYQYCIAASDTSSPGVPTAWAATGDTCPTAPVGYEVAVQNTAADNTGTWTPTTGISATAGVKYWTLCARLENGADIAYCIKR